MKRILIIAGVALLLFVVISQPKDSAVGVNNLLGGLRYGAEQLIAFVRNLFPR
ncbi:hypothetical protein GCM10010174_59230 [Kutzneria viridogrisea]|uniref:Secreted protein n=2 Tax=Kutzneria TaxID=43356 RepID=A0ABR6BL05_9PSEU|nr:hypothetical protein [Kutzneria albida]AHH95407.1 putative secreted protein [Kutzneria albida DSM 43870]MBA8927234.1 hypothetical protein [Kutzneria viridogrisea]